MLFIPSLNKISKHIFFIYFHKQATKLCKIYRLASLICISVVWFRLDEIVYIVRYMQTEVQSLNHKVGCMIWTASPFKLHITEARRYILYSFLPTFENKEIAWRYINTKCIMQYDQQLI